MSSKRECIYLDAEIKKIVEGLPPSAGKVVLDEYREMSQVVKRALDGFYAAMANIEDRDSNVRIKEALDELHDACEVNVGYDDIYEAAKAEAERKIADVISDEGEQMFPKETEVGE